MGVALKRHVLVDVDDSVTEVHGHAKQGAGFGYTGVRGLDALLATATTPGTAPVVVAQRRKGSCGSRRGAERLVTDALKGASALIVARSSAATPLVRADVHRRGLRRADSARWISRARGRRDRLHRLHGIEGADQVPGRWVVRRIPGPHLPEARTASRRRSKPGGSTPVCTTRDSGVLDNVEADKAHRGHTVIEHVHADLLASRSSLERTSVTPYNAPRTRTASSRDESGLASKQSRFDMVATCNPRREGSVTLQATTLPHSNLLLVHRARE